MIDFKIKDYIKEILPTGRYTFVVKNAEIKPTKKSRDGIENAEVLHVLLEVVSEFQRGAEVSDYFNILNPNITTQKIGREKFAKLCYVVGLVDLVDVRTLKGTVVDADINVEFFGTAEVNKVEKYVKCVACEDYKKILSKTPVIARPDIDQINDDAIPF